MTPAEQALRDQLDRAESDNSDLRQRVRALEEAGLHCVRIFRSMAIRGAYPLELLPDDPTKLPPGDVNPHFLGKQGFSFLVDAIGDKARRIALDKWRDE